MKSTLSTLGLIALLIFAFTLVSPAQRGGKPPKPSPTPTPTPSPTPGCATAFGNTNSWVGAGGLDTSFGDGGIKVTAFAETDSDAVTAILEQPDGKIVTVGRADVLPSNYSDVLVTRYNADGTLDHTFGTFDPGTGQRIGYISIDFSGGSDLDPHAVLDASGRILLVAYPNTKLARLTPDGQMDATFGVGGKVELTIANLNGLDLALRSDGKILVTGGEPNFTVAQFNEDGTLDTTFGNGGSVSVDINGSKRGRESGRAIAIQIIGGEERVVVGGGSATGVSAPSRFAVLRLLPGGARDNSFGTSGVVMTSVGGNGDVIEDIAIDASNRIIATGGANTACGGDAGYARYLENGDPDLSFSGDGNFSLDIYGGDNKMVSLALQDDGKILSGGWARNPDGTVTDFALVRLNEDGTPDSSFGPNGPLGSGIVTTSIFTAIGNWGLAITIQSDGKILFGGGSSGGGGSSIVARYIP